MTTRLREGHAISAWESLELDPSASSGRVNLVSQFYVPCLEIAERYDRAAGYFRSSLFALVGVALSSFALRGGRMRLVCSPSLTSEDADAIRKGADEIEVVSEALRSELKALISNERNIPAVRLLATLVGVKALDVRIAYRPGGAGIFHDKVGIFGTADVPEVSFVGSSNETYSAWDASGNHEVLEVFRRWESDEEARRVDRHASYFDDLWNGREADLEVRSLSEVPLEELKRWQHPDGLDGVVGEIRDTWTVRAASEARLSAERRRLMKHQQEAVDKWFERRRGIVDHATGAGKTLTAIAIIRKWLEAEKPVVVLVPSRLLLAQWLDEMKRELEDLQPAFLQVGAGVGRQQWSPQLPDFTRNLPALGHRTVLATMASAASDEFLSRVQGGDHLLVVADEVHRVGAPRTRRVLDLPADGRLGLSATPVRYGDSTGTAALMGYFGPVLPPPFGLREAIEVGRLVPYDYFIHTVSLDEEESRRWAGLTERIRRFAGQFGQDVDDLPDALKSLLIRRARIVKQAAGKVALAADVVASLYRAGDAWLVYCDSQEQLIRVMVALRGRMIRPFEYHSNMVGAREETMSWFRDRGGVMVAIKCLDEGVDIPSVTHALILASSSNPREFIQRRGRVLRKAPGKYGATVHDVLVTMNTDAGERVIDSDIRRAMTFAELARNESVRQELVTLTRHALSDVVVNFEDEDE